MGLIDRIAARVGYQRMQDTKETAVNEIASKIYYDMKVYNNWMEAYWNPNPVHRTKQWTGYHLYEQMDGDGHIYNVISLRKVALLSRPVVVRSAIPGNYTEDKKAALVQWNLDHIKRIIQKRRGILSDKDFGFSVSELIYGHEDVPLPAKKIGRTREFRGGLIEQAFVIHDIKTKIPSAFSFNGNGDLFMTVPQGVMGGFMTAGSLSRPLTKEERLHFVVSTHDPRFENPYGWPLKASMFWAYLMKKACKIYRMIFVQKYGMPVITGAYPRGTSKAGPDGTDQLFNVLMAAQANSVIIHPDDIAITVAEAGNKAGTIDVFQNVLDYCDADIAEVALGHRASVQESSGQSPFQNSDEKSALRQDLLEMDAAAHDAVWNDEVIPILIDMNFEYNGLYPYVKTIVEPEVDLDKEIFRLQAAYNMHIPLSKNQQYEKFGWDKPTEGDPDDLLLLEEEKQEKGAVPIEKNKDEDKPNGKDSSEQNPNNNENVFKQQSMAKYFSSVAERMLKG